MTDNPQNKPELWNQFAKLNPKDFSFYDGYCQCFSCQDYRIRAREWIIRQLEERKKENT